MKMGVEVLLKHSLLSDIHQLSDYFILQWDSVPAQHIICDMMCCVVKQFKELMIGTY